MYYEPEPPVRRSPSVGPLLVAMLFGAALGLTGYRLGGGRFDVLTPNNPAAVPREVAVKSGPDAEESEAITLFRDLKDSVVNVDTIALVRGQNRNLYERQTGTGSGFVWDTDGRIVTNYHVVQAAVQNRLNLRVVLADRTAHDAKIVGLAPDYDLAVLQITTAVDRLKPIKIGSSSDLQVGQKAYAIGNPFGLSLTMTKGIVSALDREIESPGERPIVGAIQTDAPINPGNSGGPLLDKDGRLIGVNTSIATPSGGNVGIGFAVPVDTVNPVVTELIRKGTTRPTVKTRERK
jgi:S1-C subfamily serine protease